jgi:hypothetical protein
MTRIFFPVAMRKTDWLTFKRFVLRVGPKRAVELLNTSRDTVDILFLNGFVDQLALRKVLASLKLVRNTEAQPWEPEPDVSEEQMELFGGEE